MYGKSVSGFFMPSCDGGNNVVSPESVPQQGHEEMIVHRYVAASSLFRKDSLDYICTEPKQKVYVDVVHTLLPQKNNEEITYSSKLRQTPLSCRRARSAPFASCALDVLVATNVSRLG